ncbi:MAG: hypothetical protein KF902_03535 [Phycisphaeraceae bacterium]|nr:hypothetical protein [Phycisphaeraceae bacterium]
MFGDKAIIPASHRSQAGTLEGVPDAEHSSPAAGPTASGTARSGAISHLLQVRPGEGRRLILSAAYFFLILFSYYMLRPVRETMGVEGGFSKLPWLMTGTLLAMLVINPVYAWFVSRTARRVFIPWTYRFFMLNIGAFFVVLMMNAGKPPLWLAYAFYIWLSVFNLFVVSIFWSVMTDVHNSDEAKRLFGAIGVGGTLGAMGGAAATGTLTGVLGPERMGYLLLLSAGVLEVAVWVARAILRRERARPDSAANSPREPGPRPLDGFRLLARSTYLQKVALYMFLFTVTATVLYVEQARVISAMYPDRADRTRAFASLDLWVNTVTLLTQLFLTARLLRWIGLTGSLLIVPLVTMIGFGVMAWAALSHAADGNADHAASMRTLFIILFIFQVTRRGLHYAIDRPARETLYTITTVDEKYKTKAFIDTFVYRLGDQVGAWGTVGAYAGLSAAVALGAVAMPVALLWVGAAFVLGRAYDTRTNAS